MVKENIIKVAPDIRIGSRQKSIIINTNRKRLNRPSIHFIERIVTAILLPSPCLLIASPISRTAIQRNMVPCP